MLQQLLRLMMIYLLIQRRILRYSNLTNLISMPKNSLYLYFVVIYWHLTSLSFSPTNFGWPTIFHPRFDFLVQVVCVCHPWWHSQALLAIDNTNFCSSLLLFSLSLHCFSPTSGGPMKLILGMPHYFDPTRRNM